MTKMKNASVGQIIRRIRAKEIAPVYALFGGDPFLEDYFIKELAGSFPAKSVEKKHLSLDQDSDEVLFGELAAISLFEEKRIIIVREIKKLNSINGKKELIQYIQSPNPSIILLLISPEYDLRKSFLKQIAENSELLDLRPPFKEEMKKWVRYITNSHKIQITESSLEQFIHNYGDSTAHVINEIEKTAIMLGEGVELNEENLSKLDGYDRVFQLWHLQDSLGEKDLNTSLEITRSLLENGTQIPQILIRLVYLYQQMLWKKMGRSKPVGYTGINKIITSNLNRYDGSYTHSELIHLLQDLRKMDVLSKSTSLDEEALLQPFIVKICRDQYV